MVSLLVRNGDALAMRPGLRGDWAVCAVAFGSVTYSNRTGVTARADRLAELPPDADALLACEEQAGRTDPYRQVAALLHVIARRPG